MKKILPLVFIVACGFAPGLFAQTVVPNQPVPQDPKRLVDGVALDVYQSIQVVLLESAAADKEIAVLDDQMEMLRERRADLCFRAAIKAHPELKEQLMTVQSAQKQRMAVEKTIAREAKNQARRKE